MKREFNDDPPIFPFLGGLNGDDFYPEDEEQQEEIDREDKFNERIEEETKTYDEVPEQGM